MSEDPSGRNTDDSFFYFEKTETCARHDGVKVTYERSKYEVCPLCAALDKIADYETAD